jgi:hypothetical protein
MFLNILKNFKGLLYILLAASLTIFYTGCSDESTDPAPVGEHFEPLGWMIVDATSKPVLVVWMGTIQTDWEGIALQDTLIAPLGSLSPHYSVKFLNESKQIIAAPTDANHSLAFAIGDTSKLGTVQEGWSFHLRGKKEGNTTIEFQVYHVGHIDARTGLIPVVIRLDEASEQEAVGARVAYEENDSTVAQTNGSTVTGSLNLKVSEQTDHIEVEFVDDEGHTFQPPVPPHSLSITVANPSLAEIEYEAEEPWVFRATGKAAGSTTFTVHIVVDGESEFTSAAIPLTVGN